MWPFDRQNRNRRLGREHVLDVKLSSSQVRAARVRFTGMALAVLFSTFLAIFLLWRLGGWMLDQLVYENPAFAIRVIDAHSDGVLSADQIRRWAGIKPGENLMALDLAGVKRDLELVPVIRSAAVERVLPQTIRLRVEERVPVAQVLQPMGPGVREQVVFTLDERGFVMMPVPTGQRANPWTATNEFYPVLTGVNLLEFRPGRLVESPQVKAALRLLAAFDRSPMAGLADIRIVDLSAPDIMTVITSQGTRVSLVAENLEGQLRRWRAIYDYVHQHGQALSAVDLSVVNNVPYTSVSADALPPAAPKPAKPVRAANTRKKNV